MTITNALTFDVEDYFMVSAFSRVADHRTWGTYESRIERNVGLVLEILDEAGVRATFFVVGWVAERYPALARGIHERGHEVGCHSYGHRMITEMSGAQFREDTRKAKEIVENAIGAAVRGYRAPSFSITRKTMWALNVLAEEGFTYDSSIFPVRHDRYGYPEFPRIPVVVETAGGKILEIPPSTLRILGQNIPFGGGGYFRLFPFWFTEWGIRNLNEREGHSAVVYLHPWELDPMQPRVPCSRITHLRHYRNLEKTEERLRLLLKRQRFTSLRALYGPGGGESERIGTRIEASLCRTSRV